MHRAHLLFLAGAALTVTGFAQTSSTETAASVSQSASVDANRPNAQVQSQTNAESSAQTALGGQSRNTALQSGGSDSLASGTSFRSTLEKPVDARKCKPGDQVFAKTTENVKSNGRVVIPKGSRILGHVTQVQAAGKGQSSSQVGVAFDHAILRNGQQIPMKASIQAIAASQANASADMMGDTMDDGAMAGGGAVASGRGAVGGLVGGSTRALGTTGGSLVNTAGSVSGGARGAVNGAGSGLNASGQLLSSSRGVVGLKGVSLDSATATAAQGSLITSSSGNLHLDSGTQMILQTNAR